MRTTHAWVHNRMWIACYVTVLTFAEVQTHTDCLTPTSTSVLLPAGVPCNGLRGPGGEFWPDMLC